MTKRMRGNRRFLIFHTWYITEYSRVVPRIEVYRTATLNWREGSQYSLWHDSFSINQIFSVLVVTSICLLFQFPWSRVIGELPQEVTIQNANTAGVGNEGFCANNKQKGL
jgi:hypothetical protein